ncbi:hypothetical protein PTSG_10389 [Salpingoeca rosetta]|uniref:J domain-containing protein n=1 Tax=Salpingoeca rosetta (strain ATCC 50818 / BSB-021) TaxID=946362 RepID=F2UR60_SALR5|nr:uncharacterized protein PTSG_10389 [Salpingoeca rosetta]EGD80115.1 hypothetical protein PTSG_10389 [Salpingoeca rosetta]|eukprot:XP_004988440.1 hypothetical protein PTSG_10389 [Salpingoeca rosetta]
MAEANSNGDAAHGGEDFYALLNVSRDARVEEIRSAYRQMCMLYHPDKHTDPAKQELAREMFPRIQRAYEVLSDEQQRAVYDIYGESGLTAGTELAPYYNTVAELKAEYEMVQRKREQEQLLAMTAPKGMISLNIDATEWFNPRKYDDEDDDEVDDDGSSSSSTWYRDDGDDVDGDEDDDTHDDDEDGGDGGVSATSYRFADDDDDEEEDVDDFDDFDDEEYFDDDLTLSRIFSGIYVSGMKFEQSVQTRPTSSDTITLNGTLSTQFTKGTGQVSGTWTHQLSPSVSTETTLAVGSHRLLRCKVQQSLQHGRGLAFADVMATHMNYRGRSLIGVGASIGLLRSLTDRVQGLLHWKVGLDSSMTTSFMYNHAAASHSLACKLSARTPSLSVQSAFPLTDDLRLKLTATATLDDVSVGYGLERQLTDHTKLGLGLYSSRAEGVSVRVKFVTMRQAYVLPIQLSDELSTSAVVYGTLFPLITYAAVRQLVIVPWLRSLERRELAEKRRRNAVLVERQRQQAKAAVVLMQETVQRKIESEERVQGLIIVQAWYGRLVGDASRGTAAASFFGLSSYSSSSTEEEDQDLVVDVTVPLQCLVKDSKLILQASSKASLVGFYDPCLDEPKQLRVVYRFHNALHEVTVNDDEELRIPKRSHKKQQQQQQQ